MAQPDFSRMTDAELEAWGRQNAPQNAPNGLGASPPVEQRALPDIPGAKRFEPFASMDDRRFAQEFANRDPNMGTMEDVSRSAVTGLQRGVASLGGAFQDMQGLPEDAALWLAQKFGGMKPEDAASIRGFGRTNGEYRGILPTSGQLNALDDKYLGPQHEPQTRPGRYSEAIASMVPAALLGPGGLGPKTVFAVGSGAGGELAADVAPDAYKPAARLFGQLVGGGPGLTAAAVLDSPNRLMRRAIGDADTTAAIALMRQARGQGINLTLAEALQQTTNNGTGLGRMQRVLEGTREGEQAFNPFFAQRPAQVDASVRRLADAIAPPTNQPSSLGPRAQTAAEGGLDTIRQNINDVARPHYDALPGNLMPTAEFAQLQANPSFAAALRELRQNAELNGPVAGLPDNDLSVINEVQKQLYTMREAARPSPVNPQGNNQLSAYRREAAGNVDALASTVSPDWRAARDIVAQGSRDYLDPLRAGPGGKVAATDDVLTQVGALYPPIPLAGGANETAQAMRLMQLGERQIPGVGADLTRQHLLTALEGATKDLQTGPNPYGGARYAKAIAGSPEQAAALNAGVGAVNGDVDRMNSLLEVLRATGKRQPAGSRTAYNAEDLKDFGIPTIDRFNPANPMDYLRGVGNLAKAGQYRRNTSRLTEILQMGPDEAEAYLRRARGR
jgi:hypothetical protein